MDAELVTKARVEELAFTGMEPLVTEIKALDEGAQVIFCGRACDVAIFAAPAIRHGIDPGLAYHAGHILECGALACDPGSASDVLAAEFAGETVTFIAFNKMRKVTPKSIAAHSLYEESHPCLQFYPEGVLVMEHTQYEAKTPTIAGIKKSLFVYSPLTLKLEGSRKIGERYISLLFCKPDNAIPESFLLYGRNGVETYPVTDQEQEIGILIKVTSKSETSAETLASLLKGYMLHYGYPNRRTTAGNIAFPISPSAINFRNNDGLCTSLVIAGTREPLFIQQYAQIKNSVIELAKNNFPEIFKQCEVEILTADAKNPLLFIDTIEKTKEEAQKKHKEVLKTIQQWVDKERMPYSCIFGGEVYRWSIYHLLKNQKIIKKLFPIKLYHADGKKWTLLKEVSADYQAIGIPKNKYQGSINPKEVNQIKKITHKGKPVGYKPLLEMATVIRTKDAGINTITYDIFFTSLHDYRAALKSNAFSKESIAKILGVPKSLIIGTFQVDTCNAIKISRYREKISGTSGSRDVFGSQQQLKIEQMVIPLMV